MVSGKLEIQTLMASCHFFSPLSCLCQLDMADSPLPACPLHIFPLLRSLLVPADPITSTCLTYLDPQNCPGCFMRPSLQSPCIRRSDMGMWLFLPPQSWGSTLTLFCFLLPWVRASPSSTLHWTPGYLFSPLVRCLDLGQRAGSGA